MLETLRIQDYALIDDLEVNFGPGFNALTGETGAGKSIVVGALGLVLGGRASNETVRAGKRQAKVDAVFRVVKPSRRLAGLLKSQDILWDDNEILLSRVVTAEGRSRAYICGNLTPVSVLAEVGDELVDLHGQHEHQSLLKPDRQLDLVDGFAGTESLAADVAALVSQLRELNRAISDLETEDRERARRMEFLRYEVSEIAAAGLQPNEEEDLKARRNLMVNAERVFTLTSGACASLYDSEEGSAVLKLDAALTDVGELVRIDERFRAIADQLTGLRAGVEEAANELRAFADCLEFDPGELDLINERLAAISDLKRKYGGSIAAILEYHDQCTKDIAAYDSRDQRLAEMRAQRDGLLKKATSAAESLSKKRKDAARKLDKQVTAALQDLGMKGGRFEAAFEATELSANGTDRVEFMLSANPGEKLKSLRHVASGGEISRIMLALKAVSAEADKIPTLVFDEIDAGVGGRIARNVAWKLSQLSRSHQTICITHIAQIAVSANAHFCVVKQTQNGRTVTNVSKLEEEQRTAEIARLLDGSVSDVSLKHAKALLVETHGT